MTKSVIINGRKRETNHHLNLQQILPSNVTTAANSVDQGSDFTATGYAVFKNDSTKAQSPLSNMTDCCQQPDSQYIKIKHFVCSIPQCNL